MIILGMRPSASHVAVTSYVWWYLRFRQGHSIISANAHLRYLNGHIDTSRRLTFPEKGSLPDI
jgi:hypothetical protein